MPQLEGQPGSRGMNPPGGISTINLSNWSDPTPPSASRRNIQANDDSFSQSGNEDTGSRPSAGLCESNNSRGIARIHQQGPGGNSTISFGSQSTAAENEALQKKRPGYDEKRKEMYGSGIFNETSGSCDGDAGYGGFDKAPAAGENQSSRGASPRSYGGEDRSDYTPAGHFDGAKHRELSSSNENLNDLTGRLSFSDAKAREMAGDNIFGPCPSDSAKAAAHNREPAGKRSQLTLNNILHEENPDPYGQKKHEMKSAELSGNNIFHDNASAETPLYHQRSVAKVREMSGSDIFSNDQPKARNTVGGIRKPPGGGSTILLA
ncbi:hypothetical protein KC19_VG252900 [Ceratodon purpureus]|uniref:DUF4057 domain-containing protein n=1 Tax=Ceratodon purpureus TaxID=3225 RepID=A0A8T0HV19_CERPU|nr:hypothetical protein KC19_VG252900 [Ceratodon purpureus]